MLVNAFLFDMESDPDDPKLVMIQKTDQGDMWALPGGRNREGETNPLMVCSRETTEEVGQKAGNAVSQDWIESLEINRGNYKQCIFVVPFSGKLRKKGLKETDNAGNFTERLGPPIWVSFEDVRRGIVTIGRNFFEIYPSHMNAIHEAFNSLVDFYPQLKPIAENTKVFAWDKGEK